MTLKEIKENLIPIYCLIMETKPYSYPINIFKHDLKYDLILSDTPFYGKRHAQYLFYELFFS